MYLCTYAKFRKGNLFVPLLNTFFIVEYVSHSNDDIKNFVQYILVVNSNLKQYNKTKKKRKKITQC